MEQVQLTWIANYIWGIADDILRDLYVRGKYRDVSFTRYFYKPQQLRSLEEIRADILAVRKETEGLLDEILGGLEL